MRPSPSRESNSSLSVIRSDSLWSVRGTRVEIPAARTSRLAAGFSNWEVVALWRKRVEREGAWDSAAVRSNLITRLKLSAPVLAPRVRFQLVPKQVSHVVGPNTRETNSLTHCRHPTCLLFSIFPHGSLYQMSHPIDAMTPLLQCARIFYEAQSMQSIETLHIGYV